MAEAEQTKICPLCAETIKAAAKVCPHCRKAQGRWFFISRFDLMAFAFLMLSGGSLLLLIKMFADGRSFSSSRDQIQILTATQAIERVEDYTNLVVYGLMTNSSSYTWQTEEFEIRYYDKSGKLTDVGFGGDEVKILAHSDHTYCLTVSSRDSIPDYPRFKVILSQAKDPRAW